MQYQQGSYEIAASSLLKTQINPLVTMKCVTLAGNEHQLSF